GPYQSLKAKPMHIKKLSIIEFLRLDSLDIIVFLSSKMRVFF
ncbi:MAG: hypothetical protein ACI8V8_001352, partial [Chitinophagales bacterium]